jgi:DNA-binding response OmpR family regulator
MIALRVLVVEDDAMIGGLLAEMVTGMGYVCSLETTEADAVAAATRSRPNLMIVDVQLGDGSGVSAMTEILRGGPVPHVFVSGDISLIRAQQPDAVILQKPFRETELDQAMKRALGVATVP